MNLDELGLCNNTYLKDILIEDGKYNAGVSNRLDPKSVSNNSLHKGQSFFNGPSIKSSDKKLVSIIHQNMLKHK